MSHPHSKVSAPHRHNLPTLLTSFVGRQEELHQVKALLSSTRLVTLTGPGGCGKTRLALQTGAELLDTLPDGVWFIELASVGDPALVAQSVAQALDLRDVPNEPLDQTLGHFLESKRLLLLLDNCEHLRAACADLSQQLLLISPHLRILATSRDRLGVTGETVWYVPSLSMPNTGSPYTISDAMQYDAPALFAQHAKLIAPTFTGAADNISAILQICERLEGMPLAIELAAARVNVLTVQQIAARLDDAFALLTGGNRSALIPRHESLRTAMDWSYELLSEKERVLFRRLSVFAGGFGVEAVETICTQSELERGEILDLLSHLIDQSLVVAGTRTGVEARHHLLETIRQYAAEKMRGSGEESLLRRCHLLWFLALAEEADSKLRGPEQSAWLEKLEAEHDNLRAALAFRQSESENETEVRLRLAAALLWFWNLHGYWSEGRGWLEAMLARSSSTHTKSHVKALFGAGELAFFQGDYAAARSNLEATLLVARELGDQQTLALTLNHLGNLDWAQGDHVRAHSHLDESLATFREAGDDWGAGNALLTLGDMADRESNLELARSLFRECLDHFTRLGDQRSRSLALTGLGMALADAGNFDQGRSLLEEALALQRDLGDKYIIARSLNRLGEVSRSQGDYGQAADLYEESLKLQHELGTKSGIAMVLHNLAQLARHRGDHAKAAALFEQALLLNRERDDKLGSAACLAGLGGVATAIGRGKQAAVLFGAVDALLRTTGSTLDGADRREHERNVAEARALLGSERFMAAREQGQKLTLKQAVSEALTVKYRVMEADQSSPLGRREQPNEREREVLRLIAEGLSNQEIAERLTIAPSTVKWHINNLFGKLAVRSRTQAVARARELGLL